MVFYVQYMGAIAMPDQYMEIKTMTDRYMGAMAMLDQYKRGNGLDGLLYGAMAMLDQYMWGCSHGHALPVYGES
jgi:hypothetical protein